MSSFFDSLKKLIDIKIDLSHFIHIHINKSPTNNQNTYNLDETNKSLEVYYDKIPTEKKEDFKQIIQSYVSEGNKLLEKETSKLLYQLYEYNKKSPDNVILSFFRPIIPPNDFEALESSLYLRYVFRQNKDIKKLKTDIRKRFGDRGNNIANLCTAGYFENFLMNLYNSSQEKFKELYEVIIDKSIVAVFVYGEMRQEDITSQIKNKIEISKKYGIKFIHIHGIGRNNITKIKECIRQQKQFFELFDKNIFERESILILELLLK